MDSIGKHRNEGETFTVSLPRKQPLLILGAFFGFLPFYYNNCGKIHTPCNLPP